jgi:predicted RNase H-like HicB family nuclease
MMYWKREKPRVGKLREHPEIMPQGENLEELEENMKEIYILMTMEDVPENHDIRELAPNV